MAKITPDDMDKAFEIVQRLCYSTEQMIQRDDDLKALLNEIYDKGYRDAWEEENL